MKFLGDGYYSSEDLRKLGVDVGENVAVHKRASIYGLENVRIGNNVRIDDFCVIVATGAFEIGSFVHIPSFCFFGAKHGIKVGDYTAFAHGVKVYSSADDYSGELLTGMLGAGLGNTVKIGEHCIIGANSIVLPGVVIENGVAVGALSLVKERLQEWGIYAGIPAKLIAKRKQKMLESIRI